MTDILELPPPPADVRITYGDAPSQFGELRLPAGPGPHPLAIGIHGGFWRARYGLSHYGHVAAALTAMGFASWSIEYRRIGEEGGGWPGTLLDVGAAADFARELAQRYPLDLARTITVGHSAGGHLALWLAGRARIDPASELWQADPLPIALAVPLAGVADLRASWGLALSDQVTGEFLGGSPDAVPERYAAASPRELLPLGVRQLVVHGHDDDSVPFAIGQSYALAAQAAGDMVELLELPDTDHFAVIDPRTPQWATIASAIRQTMDTLIS